MTRTPLAPALLALVTLIAGARSAAASTLWEELGSPMSSRSAGCYDPVRQRLVVFVGDVGHVIRAYDFAASPPRWTTLVGTPDSRLDEDFVYDPVRDRIVGESMYAMLPTTPPTFTQISSNQPTNTGRNNLVYDPFADRVLLYSGTVVEALKMTGNKPAWTTLVTSGAAPPNRFGHSVVLDKDHYRLVVFGGAVSGNPTNDVWTLSLAGTPTWTRIFPASGPPAPRSGASAIYDTRHHRMVVTGGAGGDTWELSLDPGSEHWSLLSNSGSTLNGAAAYDSLNDRMLVYATSVVGRRNGLESMYLGAPFTWTRHSPTAATAPYDGRAAVYDPVRHQYVLYASQQLWAMPLEGPEEWQPLATATPGPNLTQHAMIYDPVNDRLVTFGGYDTAVPNGWTNAIHTLTLTEPRTWGTIVPAGTPPSARIDPCAVYDPVGQRMVIFGGRMNTYPQTSDAYGVSLTGPADWTPLPVVGAPPPPRSQAMAVYDTKRQRMLVHGGIDYLNGPGTTVFGDTWALSLDGGALAWSFVPVQGQAPFVSSVPAVYDPVRDRLLVIEPNLATLRALELAGTPTWTTPQTLNPQPYLGVDDAAGVYDPYHDRMIALSNTTNPWSLRLGFTQQLAAPAPPVAVAALAIDAIRPNPAARAFSFEYALPDATPATVELFDVRGRRIARASALPVGNVRGRFAVDVPSGASPGVYFVRLSQSGRAAVGRVAVVR